MHTSSDIKLKHSDWRMPCAHLICAWLWFRIRHEWMHNGLRERWMPISMLLVADQTARQGFARAHQSTLTYAAYQDLTAHAHCTEPLMQTQHACAACLCVELKPQPLQPLVCALARACNGAELGQLFGAFWATTGTRAIGAPEHLSS